MLKVSKTGYLAWSAIIFVVIAAPTILEAFSSWYFELPFRQEEINPGKHLAKYLIVFSFYSLLIALPILLVRIKIYYLWIIGCLLFPASLFYLIHVMLFSSTPNSATLFSVFSTNQDESWEFISDYFSFSILLYSLLFAIALYLLYRGLIKVIFFRKNVAILFSCVVVFSSFTYTWFNNRLDPATVVDIPLIGLIHNYHSYKSEQEKIKALLQTSHEFRQITQKENTAPETHVVLIGESTSRHHMGIYNYWRNTTPYLEKQKNELLIFDRVTTPNAHTVEALTKAFTCSENNRGTLFDILKQGGVETWWISNQAVVGKYETPIYLFANKADHKTFTNASGYGLQFDDNVVNHLEKVLQKPATGKRIIFIHLMGTHLSYRERYPASFNYYTSLPDGKRKNLEPEQQKFINEYDNANRYNDYVIHSVLQQLKKLNHSSSMVYFSDHGDEVYDMRNFHGHSDVLQSHFMTDIPFIYWCNDTFQKANPQLLSTLQSSIHKPYSLADFSHMAQDLYGIHCEDYDKERSFSTHKSRIEESNNGLAKAPQTLNNTNFSTPIWVHRVDGTERLNEVKDLFSGFEIDVVFNETENYYDVNHPPVKSIGLKLDQLISTLQHPDKYYYWLDMKNLTDLNCDAALKQLIKIAEHYNIKDRILVESNCRSCLHQFTAQNFYTGNYLPSYHNMNEETMLASINNMADSMNSFSSSAVTQEMDGFKILDTYFNECNKLVWDLSIDWKNEADRQKTFQFLKQNPSVKVFLVRYDSPSYR